MTAPAYFRTTTSGCDGAVDAEWEGGQLETHCHRPSGEKTARVPGPHRTRWSARAAPSTTRRPCPGGEEGSGMLRVEAAFEFFFHPAPTCAE